MSRSITMFVGLRIQSWMVRLTKLQWLTPPSSGQILSPEEKLARTPSNSLKSPFQVHVQFLDPSIFQDASKSVKSSNPILDAGVGVHPSPFRLRARRRRSSSLSFSAYGSFIPSLPRRTEVMRTSPVGSHWGFEAWNHWKICVERVL